LEADRTHISSRISEADKNSVFNRLLYMAKEEDPGNRQKT